MKMLKVKFKSDVRRVREETADRENVAAVTTQERFEGLYAAKKFFRKFTFGFSLISKHSHPYPFACCFLDLAHVNELMIPRFHDTYQRVCRRLGSRLSDCLEKPVGI